MTIRTRKLIGIFALIALAIVWTLLGMALGQSILLSTNSLLAWVYYIVVGLGWVLPAMPLIRWMSRGDKGRPITPR
jgi:uncharacterized membrane protein YuzA (DUF378 family)